MLRRSNRFHGYNSLRPIYQKGKTVRGPLLSLRYAPSNRSSYRAAVVVSKKVAKSAVVRGRIRRRIFEQIRLQTTGMKLPFDMVLTAFSDQLATVDSSTLQAQIADLLGKAGITSDIVKTKESKN